MNQARFLPVATPVIGQREIDYVTDAVRSGWVSSIGPYIDRFETAFAEFCGARHAIAVSNGTVALHLALHALGIGPGDEVILPDLTFAATAHAVLQTGATPVLVDVERDSWCLDPEAARRAIGEKTRAILVVHLYGQPARMDAILPLAAEHGLAVVEDAAEAHGAEVSGRRVGPLGTAGTFSFYGNKILTTGEGGMVVTDDTALAARMRTLKDHGMSKERRYFHRELAFNYRMTNLQAALGCAQLEQVEDLLAKKRELRAWYAELLAGAPHVELASERPGSKSVCWMVCALVSAECKVDRDTLARRLLERGIDTRPFFVPMSELPHLAKMRSVGAHGDGCPVARDLSRRGLNLPSGFDLRRADVERCAAAVASLLSDEA